MSLSFDFPDHLVINFPGSAPQQQETPSGAHDWQLNDLQELSGEEDDNSTTNPADLPHQQAQSCSAAPRSSTCASVMPDEVLLLVVDLLGLREVMGLACCCKAWHECLRHSHSSDIWEQQERTLLGECVCQQRAQPQVLPASPQTHAPACDAAQHMAGRGRLSGVPRLSSCRPALAPHPYCTAGPHSASHRWA